MNKNTKVVFVDTKIIDNKIYTILDYAKTYDGKDVYYIIDNNDSKVVVSSNQIREATEIEINNNIKFNDIIAGSIVAYNDLLEPDYLLEVVSVDNNTLKCVIKQTYTKSVYNKLLTDIRPAREDEKEKGIRLPLYNKNVFISYLNPFAINDLYNYDKIDYTMTYFNDLFNLELLTQNNKLTDNGERLYYDINFDNLLNDIYDFSYADPLSTYATIDKDGTISEFITEGDVKPTYDDVLDKWFIIETPINKKVENTKIYGMCDKFNYKNSLRKINRG